MNKKELRVFNYKGPVNRFNHEAIHEFKATTSAPTLGRAIANFEARAKKELGIAYTAKVDLGLKYINEFYMGKIIIPEELRKNK